MSFQLSKLSKCVKYAMAMGLIAIPTTSFAMTSEEADLNGDGAVNFLDFYEVITRIGAERGTENYRAGLDVNNDGIINTSDYFALFGNFGQSAETNGTTFSGLVLDENSIPIEGVRVELENNLVEACTDQLGRFSMDLTEADFGENLVTFDGNGGSLADGTPCVTQDATPGTLSGEYPVIPHKPVFINGGVNNEFRTMSLPERNLEGAQEVDANNANDNGGNNFTLLDELVVENAGAQLNLDNGCTIQFPDGETPRLSITEVDPAMLPVAPPPGQSSSLFVTFQPGGSEVADCDSVVAIFDNTEMMVNDDDPTSEEQPGLRGVVNGAFQELVKVTVGDFDPGDNFVTSAVGEVGPLLRAEIPVPFDFAWYAVTVPVLPCPLTIVEGEVRLNNVSMDPVADALVSLPGIGPVFTNAAGGFSIVNVPAGPNGPRCLTNPFQLSAYASKDINAPFGQITFDEVGASAPVSAVPGGITNVGTIKLGITGTVQGSVMKLNSIDPFLPIPLPGAQMTLDPLGAVPDIPGQTDLLGNFRILDVPTGSFDLTADFDGLLPLPGGGTAQKTFNQTLPGQIDFQGQTLPMDFKFLGHGSVSVTVTDDLSQPVPGIFVNLAAFGGNFGGFTAGFEFCGGFTDDNGQLTFDETFCGDTIPMGPCELSIFGGFDGEGGFGEFREIFINELDGCFINEHGQNLDFPIQLEPLGIIGDITQANYNQALFRPTGGNPDGSDDISVVEMLLEFADPLGDFFDPYIELHLDMDQNPNTGFNAGQPVAVAAKGVKSESSITARNLIVQNVGAEARIICFDGLVDANFDLGPGQCIGVDENDNPIPGLGVNDFDSTGGGPFEFEGNLVLLIPKQPLIDFANGLPGGPFGDGPWDTVLETGFESFGDYGGYGGYGGGILFDMAPNTEEGEGPFAIDPNSNNSLADPTFDFFFGDYYFFD